MLITPASLLSAQKQRLIKLTVHTEPKHELLLDSFSGSEAISQPFSFDLALLSPDPRIELKTLIDQGALLEIELANGAHRCIHGHITAFSYLKSDGGLSHYCATLSPWLWYLGQRVDARIFQERTVVDVLRTVFAHYGALAVLRFDLQQDLPLRTHSCITQFNETDEHFVRRLLEEEGWLFYFEHTAQGHTLVVRDDCRGLSPLPQQPVIAYLQGSIPTHADTICEWTAQRVRQPDAVSAGTFDYKQVGQWDRVSTALLTPASGSVPLERYAFSGQYSAGDDREAKHRLDSHRDALHVLSKTFRGVSNCRAMEPGYTFTLTEHPRHEGAPAQRHHLYAREFLLLSVQHQGRNNYLNEDKADYRNSFSSIRRDIPYRPQCLTPRPVVAGPLTAVVVGDLALGEVYTDEWARVKVRFHWQRQQPDEHDSARQHAQDTAWLRVAQPSAGDGFGHQFMPRIGQEVVVSFIAGDINRPLITGAVYNSSHHSPRFSDVGGTGQLPANQALSGIKTKEHKGGGYNELLFDDTAGELRARLASRHQDSALNLGKLTAPRSEGRAQPLGNGAELRTNAAIALRAAQGLLLTSYAKHQALDPQLGREALLELLSQCADLFKALGETASAQGAQALDHAGIEALRQTLDQWPAADSSGRGEPLIAITGEAGIVSATPASQAHYAGGNHDTTAQDHVQMTSGAAMRLHAGQGISAFAQDAGISAIANRGKVLVQGQSDDIALNAHQSLHASAAEGEIVLTAPTIRLVADDGSYIKLGGGIEIGTAGSAIVHAAAHDWVGPKTDRVPMPAFGRDGADQRHVLHFEGDAKAAALSQAYNVALEDGSLVQGITGGDGGTEKIQREAMQLANVNVLKPLLDSGATGVGGGLKPAPSKNSPYDLTYLIKDKQTGVPLSDVKYRIQLESGDVVIGITDEHGNTQTVQSDTPQIAKIEVPYDDDSPTQPHTHVGPDTCDC